MSFCISLFAIEIPIPTPPKAAFPAIEAISEVSSASIVIFPEELISLLFKI